MENYTDQPHPTTQIPQPPSVQVSAPEYNGWLVSNNFFKRAFAVFGYGVAGYIMFLVPFMLLAVLFSGLLVGSTAFRI